MCREIPAIELKLSEFRALLRREYVTIRGAMMYVSPKITADQIVSEAIEAERMSREME